MGGTPPGSGASVALIPEDWRLLRGLLRGLGLLALVAAVLALGNLRWIPDWLPPSLPLVYSLYIGAPVVVLIAAVLVGRHFRRARVAAWIVGVLSVLVVGVNTAEVVSIDHLLDEMKADAPRRCTSEASCARLISDKFPDTVPLVPRIGAVDGYPFLQGEESGRMLVFSYASPGTSDEALVVVIAERRPDGFEPPADEQVLWNTPGGTAYVEHRADDRLRRLDWWDHDFHYAVSIQGPRPTEGDAAAAIALIDSAHRR